MPIKKPDRQNPVTDKGVNILTSKPGEQGGVKRYSKFEGGSHESQIETRIVENNEFEKTKKLVEDEDMKK